MQQQSLIKRFQKWVAVAIAFCAFLYIGWSIWIGYDKIKNELSNFQWSMFGWGLLLTLTNYSLRFVKWRYYLGRLGVSMPLNIDVWNFIAGLSMAISPGKAGELLKPYVVREVTEVPMIKTLPALITERLTDGIAMLILAGIGVTTYASDQLEYVLIPAIGIVLGLLILASPRASALCLKILEPLPVISKVIPKIEEMMVSMRTCVAPVALMWTVFLSMIAWGAECLAFKLILDGTGATAPLDASVFIYAFATIAGSAMPGGLGVSDGALAVGAQQIMGISEPQALTAMMLTRLSTLWLGVGLGAIALVRLSGILELNLSADPDDSDEHISET